MEEPEDLEVEELRDAVEPLLLFWGVVLLETLPELLEALPELLWEEATEPEDLEVEELREAVEPLLLFWGAVLL